MSNVPALGIILGDHAGSSPEMSAKAVLTNKGNYIPVFIGNRERFEISYKAVEGAEKLEISVFNGRPEFKDAQHVYFIDIPAGSDIEFGKVTADSGRLTYESIKKTIELQKGGLIDGILMAPITKAALHDAGYSFSTEFEIFKALYEVKADVRAVIKCGDLFRSTVVGHCAFVDITKRLCKDNIKATAYELINVMSKFKPREKCSFAVAALNPHAGEGGIYGTEEITIIEPAIKELVQEGYNVIGPSPADTVFLKAINRQVDGVVFLYHDQGNIAMKSIYFGDGVLIYTNLPADIVSVGHGPAYGKAGKGTADPKNMIAAAEVLIQLVNHRLAE